MQEALKRIIKERNYHNRQIEENLAKIQTKKESIQALEEYTQKEIQIVNEYDEIIALLESKVEEEEPEGEEEAAE